MDRVRLPVDGDRAKPVVKQVWERRQWFTNDEGVREQSKEQATTKAGVPLYELVCVTLGSSLDTMRVVVPSSEPLDIEAGTPVKFEELDGVVWQGKNGIGVDYYAKGVIVGGNKAAKAA